MEKAQYPIILWLFLKATKKWSSYSKKIIHQLDLLQDLGPLLKEPQVKFIKGYKHPLMELRPQPERIFYASWNKNRYILLHHYSKKKNRTDPREVHIAINRLDDWLQRH